MEPSYNYSTSCIYLTDPDLTLVPTLAQMTPEEAKNINPFEAVVNLVVSFNAASSNSIFQVRRLDQPISNKALLARFSNIVFLQSLNQESWKTLFLVYIELYFFRDFYMDTIALFTLYDYFILLKHVLHSKNRWQPAQQRKKVGEECNKVSHLVSHLAVRTSGVRTDRVRER